MFLINLMVKLCFIEFAHHTATPFKINDYTCILEHKIFYFYSHQCIHLVNHALIHYYEKYVPVCILLNLMLCSPQRSHGWGEQRYGKNGRTVKHIKNIANHSLQNSLRRGITLILL